MIKEITRPDDENVQSWRDQQKQVTSIVSQSANHRNPSIVKTSNRQGKISKPGMNNSQLFNGFFAGVSEMVGNKIEEMTGVSGMA